MTSPLITVVAAAVVEQGRLLVLDPSGAQVKEMPLEGSAPVGVAVAPDGRVLTADAKGNLVYALPAL